MSVPAESPPFLVSPHLVRVHDFVKIHGGWVTCQQIADRACVSARGARSHAVKLVDLGIFERTEVYPGYRYRFVVQTGANPMSGAIDAARDSFGVQVEHAG